MKKTSVIQIREDEYGVPYIDLHDLIPLDMWRVETYSMEIVDDDDIKKLMLQFFDKDGNVIDIALGE